MSAPVIEEWRPIHSCPGYEVSSLGRVRRTALTYGNNGSVRKPSGVLSTRALPFGHRQVTVSINNVPATHLVHRLVAEAFLPAPADGQDCVCHRDDDPSNNSPRNLFWGTRSDNSDDKVRKGRQARGERVKSARLTESQVLDIRKRAISGENQYDLAREYGVTQSNISMIVNRVTWGHVP
jgi:hypothetical protein